MVQTVTYGTMSHGDALVLKKESADQVLSGGWHVLVKGVIAGDNWVLFYGV